MKTQELRQRKPRGEEFWGIAVTAWARLGLWHGAGLNDGIEEGREYSFRKPDTMPDGIPVLPALVDRQHHLQPWNYDEELTAPAHTIDHFLPLIGNMIPAQPVLGIAEAPF